MYIFTYCTFTFSPGELMAGYFGLWAIRATRAKEMAPHVLHSERRNIQAETQAKV